LNEPECRDAQADSTTLLVFTMDELLARSMRSRAHVKRPGDYQPGEAAAVRRIFERFAMCRSALTVIRELAAEGLVNKYGQKLDRGRV
jgi:hypothetical protein